MTRVPCLLWGAALGSALCVAQPESASFSYAPSRWQTIIGFADDWQKTLVTEQGALAYDFGPGPYARPLTEVAVGLRGEPLAVQKQLLEDPRVPIITTSLAGGTATVSERAFALVPPGMAPPAGVPAPAGRVRRIGGTNGCAYWTNPGADVDPAFQSVAWGTNRPILYRVSVPPGSRKRVAVGLCESYKPRAGMRLIELRVEGAPPVTADPMALGRKNEPRVLLFDAVDEDRDGELRIEAHASPGSPDPNVILNCFWVFPAGAGVTAEDIISGRSSALAEVCHPCGTELEANPPVVRTDVILAAFSGNPAAPVITIRTPRSCVFDTAAGYLDAGVGMRVVSRPKPVAARKTETGWELDLPAGTREAMVCVTRGSHERGLEPDLPDPQAALTNAQRYWTTTGTVPRNPFSVPDTTIQYLLETSIRTIYQVRDVVDGRMQFQPGPTVYRGLWAGDAAITGVPVMMLGDTAGAREFLETAMACQLPGGQIRSLYPAVSLTETPAVITAMCLYAKYSGDDVWLRGHWPVIVHGIDWIRRMQASTLHTPSAPFYGLMPPGFVDGGISAETADYGSVWWALISVEKALEAASRLGISQHVDDWNQFFNVLMDASRKAARRDLRPDTLSRSAYLPIGVGDTSASLPQRGQFAFLIPLRYGDFFQHPDSLFRTIIAGNLAMLDARKQEGLIPSSGWLNNGVWSWLGGIHGIAHDMFGSETRAHELLYAFANHASTTGTWVEEQLVRTAGTNTTGDVSDAEASAVFVHLVRNLLVRERLHDLELFAGIPPGWLDPGSRIEVNGAFTEFGPISTRMMISTDGRKAEITVRPIDGHGSSGSPVVFLKPLQERGFTSEDGTPLPDAIRGIWGKEMHISCRRKT